MRDYILFVLISMLLCGCRSDPDRIFIQGIWVARSDETSASSSQAFIQWQFDRGKFILQQEGRGQRLMISEGSYRVLDSGKKMTIELYNISGDVFTYNNLPVEYALELDIDKGTLRINSRLYDRID